MSDMWPAIEYEESYPVDEELSAIRALPMDFAKAAFWLLNELPQAAENMPCFCNVLDIGDDGEKGHRIEFSTYGWSGAESITALIEARYDLSHFMQSWRRGGHYVFEFPARWFAKADPA